MSASKALRAGTRSPRDVQAAIRNSATCQMVPATPMSEDKISSQRITTERDPAPPLWVVRKRSTGKSCQSCQSISQPFDESQHSSRGTKGDRHEAGKESGSRHFMPHISQKTCETNSPAARGVNHLPVAPLS